MKARKAKQPDDTIVIKPSIFIASSKEALPVANAVKQHFDQDFEVDVWNENVFDLNAAYLDSLLNLASYYDFGIAIFGADDLATVRNKKVKIPRDNVIFEFGLLLGRLGQHRTFFLLEKGVKLLSDWSGIKTATFEPRDNMVAAVGGACDQIRGAMKAAAKLSQFSMLPSTALAMGYHRNFLDRIIEAFERSDEFKIILEKDKDGKPVRERAYKVTNRHPTIEVMVPENLIELEPTRLKLRLEKYKQISISMPLRSFPFYVSADFKEDGDPGDMNLVDVPTTLLASKIAIEKIFSEAFLATNNRKSRLERREIANFENTLRKLNS